MLIDVDDLIEEGLDLEKMAAMADQTLLVFNGCKSKEAQWLEKALEQLRDECEFRAGPTRPTGCAAPSHQRRLFKEKTMDIEQGRTLQPVALSDGLCSIGEDDEPE